MKFTVFDTLSPEIKFCSSPFGDNTFIFNTIRVESEFDICQILARKFVLCLPLCVDTSIRCSRKAEDLNKLKNKYYDYLVFDFNCYTKENLNDVLSYLKAYKCLILESRSYNNIDNFSLRGIIFTEPLNLKSLKNIHTKLKFDLRNYGDLNDDLTNVNSYVAPTLKSRIILSNLNAECIKVEDSSPKINKLESIDFKLKSKTRLEKCLETFDKLGYKIISSQNTSENSKITTLLRFSLDSDDQYFWYSNTPHMMYHRSKLKWLDISQVVSNINIKNYIEYKGLEVSEITLESSQDIQNLFNKFLDDKSGVLSLRSYMASGKTGVLKTFFDKLSEKNLRVLIITSRISIARHFSSSFKIPIYLSSDSKISKGSLVCQYDSLYKFKNHIDKFDLFILDEYISLMFHSVENATNNSLNDEIFYKILKQKLIISDAFLSDYMIKLLGKRKYYNIINNNRDPIILREVSNIRVFRQEILNILNKGFKVSISVTSRNSLKDLEKFLNTQGFKVLTISSDTDESERHKIIEYLEESGSFDFDALIFTPIINVGISINREIFFHFHYDKSIAVDTISSLQMTRRVRSSRVLFYYIQNYHIKEPISLDLIENEMIKNRPKLVSNNIDFNSRKIDELSSIGKFRCKIKLFMNYLKINPRLSFNTLLGLNYDLKYYKFIDA